MERLLSLPRPLLLTAVLLTFGAGADVWTSPQPALVPETVSAGRVDIESVPVPLNQQNPSVTAIGDFQYAGGVMFRSSKTNLVHELSDIVMTGNDRIAAVGDAGVFLQARLVLDGSGRLIGITDAVLTRLVGETGKPLLEDGADAEGLTILPSGDRLVSFEKDHRILLYPSSGGLPRRVPSPRGFLPFNAGMEALAVDTEAGADAYLVGMEETGETWNCRLSAQCVKGATVEKPKEFGLVAIQRLAPGTIAYLLRAYDPVRKSRIVLQIVRGTVVIARLDLAQPMTVDNFEGMTSLPSVGGGRRFYLISDDNNDPSQRTLLLAFDWQPR